MTDDGKLKVRIGPLGGASPPVPAPNAMDEETLRWNRLAAEHEIQFMTKLREAGIDQATAMAKWLLASLLAINGAGTLAAINNIGKLSEPAIVSGLFVVGMLLPLLSATVIQHANYAALKPLQEYIAYFLTVVDDGIRDEEMEKSYESAAKKVGRLGLVAPLFGWLSGICFLAGAFMLGSQMAASALSQ